METQEQPPAGAAFSYADATTTFRVFAAPLGLAMSEALRITLHLSSADLDTTMPQGQLAAALRTLQGEG